MDCYLDDMKALSFALIFLGSSLSAELLDGIAAIVGGKIITQSEVAEASFFFPSVDEETLVNQLIERELLLIQAGKDSLEAGEEEIEQAVERSMLSLQGRFPSDEAYRLEIEKMNTTEEELKERYRKDIRVSILIEKLRQKRFARASEVSDVEVIEFYNSHLDSIPPLPDAIKLLGVMVYYDVSAEARETARTRVDDILLRIKRGKKTFAEVAKKHSDDPGTAEKGGDLGNLNVQDLSQEFQAEVTNMVAGEVAVIPGSDAFHIIRCNARQGETVNLSDIVVRVPPTRVDSGAAQILVDSVTKALENEETVEMPNVSIISWGEDFVPLSATPFVSLESVETGKVYTFDAPNGFQVIKPTEKQHGRQPTWEDVRETLRQLVGQRKMQKLYDKLLKKLREEIFVERK
jgi:peptidyl-prolyl cis-trans isomerase SurA